MNDNLLDKKINGPKIAERHVDKYIYDLQRHFNLSDSQIVKVLNSCISNFKKKNIVKKWWRFF
jgi:hypothetical protein